MADTEQVEEGGRGVDGGREEATDPVLVLAQVRVREQGDVGDELVGVVVAGNVQAEGVGNGRIHRVGSSRMEGDHRFHTGSGKGEVRMWQAVQVVGCDSDVKGVAAVVAAQWSRMNNCRGGRTAYGLGEVESGKLERLAAVAEVAGSVLV